MVINWLGIINNIMVSIRRNVFETNSSSTHSLSINESDKIEEMIEDLRHYNIEDIEDLYGFLGHVRELEEFTLNLIRSLKDD